MRILRLLLLEIRRTRNLDGTWKFGLWEDGR
jgi:hypothetical protein